MDRGDVAIEWGERISIDPSININTQNYVKRALGWRIGGKRKD